MPLVLIELIWLRRRKELSWARVKHMLANVSTLVPVLLVGALTTGLATAGLFALWRQAPIQLALTPMTALCALIGADLLYYWEHRIAHEVRAIWALGHSIHHSSPVFDQSTSVRLDWFGVLLAPLFLAPLVLVGFHPTLVLVASALVLAWQGWIHTELVGKLGVLDRWFNTPSAHRVHHATNPQYLDRNYGGVLMVWDHLFGTFAAEVEQPVYGILHPLPDQGFWTIHTLEVKRWWADRQASRPASQASTKSSPSSVHSQRQRGGAGAPVGVASSAAAAANSSAEGAGAAA